MDAYDDDNEFMDGGCPTVVETVLLLVLISLLVIRERVVDGLRWLGRR